MQTFITWLSEQVAGNYVRGIIGTLSELLSTAKKWGYICEGVDLKNLALPQMEHTKGRTFTPDQGKQIIAAVKMPLKLMCALAGYCGRAGEIMGLRAEDIDLGKKTITISQTAWRGKTQTAKTKGSETNLPIPEPLCELLRANMPTTGLLFINRRGRPYTADKVVKKLLRPLLDELGIPRAGFHAFRHMHTTLLLDCGASIKTAQRQFRHADARTTLDNLRACCGTIAP